MEFIDSNVADEDLRGRAWQLIECSFPLEEQRTLDKHIEALSDPAFHARIITDNGKFIGILFYWVYDEKYYYVEHLATDPELRGGGYGAQIMEWLTSQGYITILEIDPPVDEISIRRKGFYERVGFHINNDYEHIHPSYRRTTKPHLLKIMSHPREISRTEFERFRDYSSNHIWNYTEK